MNDHNYFVYIVTNPKKTVLYTGVTNDLFVRMVQHYLARGTSKSFAGKYYCYNLIYYEQFQFIQLAIERETEIKAWRREKKEALIKGFNPMWRFLNIELFDAWEDVLINSEKYADSEQ